MINKIFNKRVFCIGLIMVVSLFGIKIFNKPRIEKQETYEIKVGTEKQQLDKKVSLNTTERLEIKNNK